MSVVLKRSGGVSLVGGQGVRQEKKVIEVIVDGVLSTDGESWILVGVELDPQKLKKAGFEDGDVVKITLRTGKDVRLGG